MTKTPIMLVLITLLLTACANSNTRTRLTPTPPPTLPAEPQIRVMAEGLIGPLGLALLPGGALLVAEAGSGQNDNSAGVSLVTPEGQVGRLISGLPSSRDAGDLAGVNAVALSPDGATIYLGNFGQGHLWTLPLTAAQQQNGLSLPDTPLTTEQLTPAMVKLNNVFLTNPFDITFDANGAPVVTDASGNGVAKENPDGTTRFIHRFDELPDPITGSERVTIEAVPTGLTRVDEEYYITLTGGCPFPEEAGRLVAIDEQRHQRTLVDNLNMPIDVARGPDGTIWVLEFARFNPGASCFTGQGYRPHTGRLSQLRPDGTLTTIVDELNFPAAVLPLPDGSVYISQVLTGQVIQIIFP